MAGLRGRIAPAGTDGGEMPDLKGFFIAAPHDTGDPVMGHYYEAASPDPNRPQVWGYTDRLSYAPGERLVLHLMSPAREVRVTIARDGLHRRAGSPRPPKTVRSGAAAGPCNWR